MLFLVPLLLLAAPPAPRATLAFVGDINFRDLGTESGIFEAVRPTLDAADLAVGNLEGLLLDHPSDAYKNTRINITASSRFVATLPASGIDVFGLANNHTWDHGADGLREHLGHLRDAGLATFGAAADDAAARAARRVTLPVGCVSFVPATLKSNKKPPRDTAKAGVSAATYAIDRLEPLIERLRAERAAGCFVIAWVHAGKERAGIPPKAVATAYRALAQAADLVVGHHPHVLEGVEVTASATIAYSLGNFLFRNDDADKRRSGVMLAELVKDSTVARRWPASRCAR
ncbi:MAG: CapA family protein [Myxococcota bacterium]